MSSFPAPEWCSRRNPCPRWLEKRMSMLEQVEGDGRDEPAGIQSNVQLHP